jgi:hypothetical protein
MKKLALALVCLVSVAFFASCTPEENLDPTIAVMTGENFVYDGQTVDLGVTYSIGFHAVSNTNSKKDLTSFNLHAALYDLDGTTVYSNDTTIAVTGNEYEFLNNNLVFVHTVTRDLVGKAIFTATITDAAARTKSVILTININQPAQDLVVNDLKWYRLGNDIQGLEEYGMMWKGNYPRDTYAKLVPMDNVKLYTFTAEDWANVNTDVDKAALFLNAIEHMLPSEEYFKVNVTQASMIYNDVIGTVMPDGTCHLMHITKSTATYVGAQGTEIVITGEAK